MKIVISQLDLPILKFFENKGQGKDFYVTLSDANLVPLLPNNFYLVSSEELNKQASDAELIIYSDDYDLDQVVLEEHFLKSKYVRKLFFPFEFSSDYKYICTTTDHNGKVSMVPFFAKEVFNREGKISSLVKSALMNCDSLLMMEKKDITNQDTSSILFDLKSSYVGEGLVAEDNLVFLLECMETNPTDFQTNIVNKFITSPQDLLNISLDKYQIVNVYSKVGDIQNSILITSLPFYSEHPVAHQATEQHNRTADSNVNGQRGFNEGAVESPHRQSEESYTGGATISTDFRVRDLAPDLKRGTF